MSCRDWEERIALHAGGGEAGDSAAAVERHLAECPRCRETAASYGWGLELLRQAHREPIAAAHYAAVRARVLANLERKRQPVWRTWRWGLASAVAALAIIAVIIPRPVGRTGAPAASVGPSAFLADKEPVAQATRPAALPVAKPAARRKARPALTQVPEVREEGRPGGQEAVTIKLLTDDPNVIIYWIADKKGE